MRLSVCFISVQVFSRIVCFLQLTRSIWAYLSLFNRLSWVHRKRSLSHFLSEDYRCGSQKVRMYCECCSFRSRCLSQWNHVSYIYRTCFRKSRWIQDKPSFLRLFSIFRVLLAIQWNSLCRYLLKRLGFLRRRDYSGRCRNIIGNPFYQEDSFQVCLRIWKGYLWVIWLCRIYSRLALTWQDWNSP